MNFAPKYPAIHSQQKHAYRDTFGDAHYSIMTSTIKTYSQLRTNIQHYYNKNHKTHTGIYMTQ